MTQWKALGASWLRSFIAAGLALFMAGVTDPKALLKGGASAVVPVIMRYLNPKDSDFGINAK